MTARKIAQRPFAIESIERRDLMAADITFSNGHVLITGTEASDQLVVGELGTQFVAKIANQAGTVILERTFSLPSVTKVTAQGLGQSDQIWNLSTVPFYGYGGVGDDILIGNVGFDFLDGGADNDRIAGLSGDDTLIGGIGNDEFWFDDFETGNKQIIEAGGRDSDTLNFEHYDSSAITVDLQLTTSQQVAPGLFLKLSANGMENVEGTENDDVILGNNRVNFFFGKDGNDRLEGRGNNDVLDGGPDRDSYVFSGTKLGADRVIEWQVQNWDIEVDELDFSGLGAPVNVNLNTSFGPAAQSSAVQVYIDNLNTMENVLGSQFNDNLKGSLLDNTLLGGGGNDILEGLAGNDDLQGGLGNDTYRFWGNNLGFDKVTEIPNDSFGVDTIDFAQLNRGVNFERDVNTGVAVGNADLTLTVALDNSIENLIGTSFDDTLIGNALNNTIKGNAGSDTLEGKEGNDTLWGGAGVDYFVFSGNNLGIDQINDKAIDGVEANAVVLTDLAFGVDFNMAAPNGVAMQSAGLTIKTNFDSTITAVFGTRFSDTIRGNSLQNYVFGDDGADTVFMLDGVMDWVDGGDGVDNLFGDAFDELNQ